MSITKIDKVADNQIDNKIDRQIEAVFNSVLIAAPLNVIVTNSDDGEIDGVYTYRATYNNKPLYVKEGQPLIDDYLQVTPHEGGTPTPPPGGIFPYAIYWRYGFDQWEITVDRYNLGSIDGLLYTSPDNVEYPWMATTWTRIIPSIEPRDPVLTPQG